MHHPLRQVVYISRASGRIAARDLVRIQSDSLPRNLRLRVSGFLIYSGGYFLQMLEGPNAAILETLERIAADDRHTDITRVYDRPGDRRLARGWSMAVFNLDQYGDPSHLDGDPRLGLVEATLNMTQIQHRAHNRLRLDLAALRDTIRGDLPTLEDAA